MILFFLLFVLLLNPVSSHAMEIHPGAPAPGFSLKSIEGKPVSLNTHKGKLVILVYWRPDQVRAVNALKDNLEIEKKYKGKGAEVIGIVPGNEDLNGVRKIIESNKIDFPILIDADRTVFGDYGIRVYPSTIVIGKGGEIVNSIAGYASDYLIFLEGYIRLGLGEINEAQLDMFLSPQKKEEDKSGVEAERKYTLAVKLAREWNIDKAIEKVKESISLKPDFAKAHTLLGFLYMESKETEKAMEEFKRSLGIDADSNETKTGMGKALIIKGDIDQAIDILTAALTANPYPEMTLYELGLAYEIKGDKDKALENFKKSSGKILNKNLLPSFVSKRE